MTKEHISRSSKKRFLDLDFDTFSFGQVCSWLAERRAGEKFTYMVTPNVEHIVQIEADPSLLSRVYGDADLCVCDSRILAAMAHLLGHHLTVIPGSDVVVALFDRILQPSDKICLIGGSDADANALRTLYPQIEVLHHPPPMRLRYNPEARLAAVQAAKVANARFILLAVGCPQQELIAWEMKQNGTLSGTALCIGAAVDFVIGTQTRAPRLLQKMGMEWAWRMASNPRRLTSRYLVRGPRIFAIAWRWWRNSSRPLSR